MAKDLNFTSDSLLNFHFKAVERGYDPLQVDEVLDKIIEDYRRIESNDTEKCEKLIEQINELKKMNESLSEQLEKEKNRVKYLPRDQKDVHIDNYELLIRIGKLEALIYEKLNISPEEIK